MIDVGPGLIFKYVGSSPRYAHVGFRMDPPKLLSVNLFYCFKCSRDDFITLHDLQSLSLGFVKKIVKII